MPHPCKPGGVVRAKDWAKAERKCRMEEPGGGFSFGGSPTGTVGVSTADQCPKFGKWEGSGEWFIRGQVGAGWQAEVGISGPIWPGENPFDTALNGRAGWTGSAGASIQAGISGIFFKATVTGSGGPCCGG